MQDHTSLAADLLASVLVMLGQQPLDTPHTVTIEPARLQQRICARKCQVYAWYAPEGTIYLDKRLDVENNLFAKGILVHELVHHIQRMRLGRAAENCKEWQARERAAYTIQYRWLKERGLPARNVALQARLIRCFPKKT